MNSFFDVIEDLTRSRKIMDGVLEDAVYEILEKAAKSINAQRVNAWLCNEEYSQIQCIGNYDLEKQKLVSQSNLAKIAMPKYFKLFETEKIIATHDALKNHRTSELLEIYLKPNKIQSLMDIPMRIEGAIIGVLCFENTKEQHVWTEEEKKFGLVVSQILSLAVETHERMKVKKRLEDSLKEQTILLQEIHHRVKNNLAVVSSLINLQSEKAKDAYHLSLFKEVKIKIDTIASVHHLLYQSKKYSSVNFKEYLIELLQKLANAFYDDKNNVTQLIDVEDIELPISTAIPMALIVNEIITNSYKHAFIRTENKTVEVQLKENNNSIMLIIKDNGIGYDLEKIKKSSAGLDIVDALINQMGAEMHYSNVSGSVYEITIKK